MVLLKCFAPAPIPQGDLVLVIYELERSLPRVVNSEEVIVSSVLAKDQAVRVISWAGGLARFDAHLPQCNNLIVPVCRVGRAQETIGLPSLFLCALRGHGRPTASIPHFLRAHSGSTGAIWVPFLTFWCAAFREHED